MFAIDIYVKNKHHTQVKPIWMHEIGSTQAVLYFMDVLETSTGNTLSLLNVCYRCYQQTARGGFIV